ncbi:glycosyltransferase [Pleomorphomonas carboxyditropha]|uniref:Glycosyl transferase n=1 Tax=Pleomorphomonas carboxyditropha TaxID=2023338 RepID=A0A2G9WSQ6_9HYPH|nr:glycosyltransferase [Pleomorphomonas carboxyditropha]PIO97170.1 glycosyl transferase [Pleomorphomonas carboxyditropha]
MKVAIVHYWLVGMRGGERVLEVLGDLYPQAVIITHVVDRENLSERILRHEIRETFISRLPGAKKHYQKYLPLMPLALEMMDMQEFDLVISSESGPAKGIIPRPDALHVCYCHSPMRYIWDHFHVYRNRAGLLTRLIMPLIAHLLRIWDVSSAARVDAFIANSNFVAQRIKTYYRREAQVIAPPVAVQEFLPIPVVEVGDHYLLAGELVSYKRPDLAILAFTRSGRELRVIGDGDQRKELEAMAGPNVKFLGKLSFEHLRAEFAHAKALIFPGEEDFGIIPVEVMAAGRPVIAYGRGGILDSVLPQVTGLFFHEQTPEALEAAVKELEIDLLPRLNGVKLRVHAEGFSPQIFAERMKAAVEAAWKNSGKFRVVQPTLDGQEG